MTKSRNGGFTLVELIVTMAIGTIITLACTTVLLLGLRIYHQSTETATRQNEIRVGLTVMENILAEGTVTAVESTTEGWKVVMTERTLLYNKDKGTIGTDADATILENIIESTVTQSGKLLTVTVKISEEQSYTISVYCRMSEIEETESPTEAETITEGSATTRAYAQPGLDTVISAALSDKNVSWQVRTFLKTLTSQVGSKGRILTDEGEGDWYSQWYIGDYAEHPGWSEATPWCACFVSWALEECGGCLNGAAPKFANVDSFCAEFVTTDNWKTKDPQPGDVIFFDWIVDSEYNPQHVGVVLAVRDGWVYTIEGNSNGRVAVCRYAQDDPRILGYGILNWT